MKKSSIILSLLTLTAALATLPALGDLNYLKNGYKYIEKIPIKVSSSINNTNRKTDNLLDNNKNTEWISWKENVIWEEDYSQPRYFTGTAIDGVNATMSTISNNTLSIPEVTGGQRHYRQYRLFQSANSTELLTLKADETYNLKLRYRGTIPSTGNSNNIQLFLGQYGDGNGVQMTVPVSTEWKDTVVSFTMPKDISNAFCCVQPGTYPGIIEVDSAELSYETDETSAYTYKLDYNNLEVDGKKIGPDPKDANLFSNSLSSNVYLENGVLVAEPNGQDYYQFRTMTGLDLKPGTTYRVTYNIRGESNATNVGWWFGGAKWWEEGDGGKNGWQGYATGKTLSYGTEFAPHDFTFTTPNDLSTFGGQDFQVITIQAYDNREKIEIKSIKLEELDTSGNVVATPVNIDYSYFSNLQNWPYKNGNEYIPALVTDNGKTVVRVNGASVKSNSDTRFRLATDIPIILNTYTLKARIKADSEGTIKLLIGNEERTPRGNANIDVHPTEDYFEYSVDINTSLPSGNDYWILFDELNYAGNFSVESFEFVSKTDLPLSWTITNDGTNAYGDDPQYREVKDGIIYSYPLPERRKVVLAVGDGAHTSQQYENKAGFELKNNHIYSVVYRIKGSDGSYPVKTVLANSNGWDTVGESGDNAMPTDGYADIRNNISTTQYAQNGAVVLDLGYNVGSVDIENIRVIDNFDETIGVHAADSKELKSQTQEAKSTDNFRTQQFYVANNLALDPVNKNYKVVVTLRGSEPGQLCLKLGDYWPPQGNRRYLGYQSFGAGNWNDLTFDCTDDKFKEIMNGSLTLQLVGAGDQNSKYNGAVDIKSVILYSYDNDNWVDGNAVTWAIPQKDTYNYYSFDGAIKGEITKEGDEVVLTVSRADLTKYYQFFVIDSPDNGGFEKGRSYKLKGLIKAPDGNVSSIHVELGTWGNSNAADIQNVTNNWTEIDIDLGKCPLEKSGFLLFQPNGDGPVQIKNLRLVPNANETRVLLADYTGNNHAVAIPTGNNIFPEQHSYDTFQYTNDNGLHLEPQGNPTVIIENMSFDLNKTYTAEFNLNVSSPGKYLVTLGNERDNQSQEITVTQDEVNEAKPKKVEFSAIPAETGSLSITPLVYTQSLEVTNGKVSYTTPEFNGGSLTGTDYFEVELDGPYTMDKEGKYVFHIGYAPNGENLEEATPKEFVILGSNSKNGTYKRLGTYEVGEYKDGNAFISTVNSPLNIESNDIKYLRFMCTSNEGSSTAICFPVKADGSNDLDNAYIGSMIRMTRFGMYKQSEMFATDKAEKNGNWDNYTRWAMPMLTRFQIEALGQKYAYPGATLHDMVGVGKSIEICGQLFDNDPYNWNYNRNLITYWDTTLPFLRDTNLGTDKYQYLDYEHFTYEEEYNGNRNYDCIDLLLPKFEDLGAVKKLNGKVDSTNGIYQVVVSMKRSTGTVEEPDNRMVYTNETTDFTNRGNGFPMEISYQGLKLDADHNKTLVPIDLSERVLTFQNVAEGDSIQFALKIEQGWNGVRIFCRENTGNIERRAGGTKSTKEAGGKWSARTVNVQTNAPGENERGTRIMRLGEIRAYVELEKIDIENNPARYDLLYNFRENFDTRSWEHNQGIIADINNLNTENGSTGDKYMTKGVGGQTWKDVIDTYKDFFDAQGLSYPDFSMINNPFNDEDVVPSNGRKRNKNAYNGQQRQRTYTILHEVLALPGERVDLYPQSDIWQANGYNYEEQFVRWYDYLTDKAPDYLYFFAEPKSVIKTTDAGFIGGKTLLDHGLRGKGTVASIYYNEKERLAYQDSVDKKLNPQSNRYYYDNQYNTVRIMDNWVAADFSLSFNTNLAERLGKNTTTWENEKTTIQEPIVNFRHLFHITSGSLFADRYMWTAEGNRHYAKSNRRYISSFANKTFKIRLEQAMPVLPTTKSAFYYRTQNDEYKRVRGYEIRTYRLGDKKSDDVGDAITLSGNNLQGEADVVPGMFGIDNDSKFNHIDSYVQTTTPSSRWLRNSLEFARAIACDGEKADAGRYLVRLYGKDEDGNIIGLQNEGRYDKPLVIAEYEVEFMGNEYASFLPEEKIDDLDKNGGDLAHHTEKYLETHYGATSDVKAVNFDKYTILNSESVIVDKGSAPVNFRRYGFFENATGKSFKYSEEGKTDYVSYTLNSEISRMKMPIRWSDSNYGFGYMTTGDYNMFRLADHSLMTPYYDAASARYNETVTGKDKNGNAVTTIGVNGTYDRLFYNTGGTEKGLFYYVNAAADPGEMVKIDFDYLCPGSTIYVSAWVNEFNNGQPETANVIFNFYANVAKGEGEDKTIIRQEQIHGFASGYVERGTYIGPGETGNYRDGDQGKWMHVYYSFVPDDSHADVVKAEGEYIDSYYLVLENNSISSQGADYAIDDIRAYVIAPRVEAKQSNTLCERNDVNIDIEVELPLEALVQSLTGQDNEDGIVSLQYSIVDKVKYDKVLKDIEAQHEDDNTPYEFSTDDYYSAFAEGVLHYKHMNIKTSDPSGTVEKPLSWGVIEFYMGYNDAKYKDADGKYKRDTKITAKDGITELVINGRTWTIGDYMDTYFTDIYEKCFVFKTQPVSENEEGGENYNEIVKSHRDYYIVVDNIGTDHVFSSLFYDIDNEGNIKKDEAGNDVFLPGFSAADLTKYNSDVYPDKKENENYPVAEWKDYDKELAKAFKIGSNCARMAPFKLKGSAQIVIDGVLHENDDNITCCENQRPVVQINLKTKEKDKENPDLEVKDEAPESENPYLDWWTGPFEKFADETSNITENGQILTLWDILDNFRTAYPHAETWNMPTFEEQSKVVTIEGDEIENPYTNSMRDYLKGLCAMTKVNEQGETVPVEPKLILHQSSYVFPQSATKLVDENGKKVHSKDIYVTAIPPATPTLIKGDDGKDYVICTQPREVKITVSNTSPTLFNGFSKIPYPDEIEDVPLRIGLKQLDKVNAGESGNELFVPLRNVNPATYDVTEFLSFGTEIYLVETNDPNYRRLSDNDKLYQTDPTDTYNVETRVVGKVTNLFVKFKKEEDVVTVEGTPMAQVVFDPWTQGTDEKGKKLDQGIIFREGYYYKFKFNFKEGETKMLGQEGYEMPCNGQTVFSIKVVPEYQIWTGDSSLNWNNDDNWRRVRGTEELLADSDTPYGIKKGLSAGETSDVRFTVNDAHPNTHSYAPLNFTKVIIPAGASYPQLAPRKHSQGAVSGAETIPVANGRKEESYVWASPEKDKPNSNAPRAVTAAGNGKESITVGLSSGESYHPTLYVQYDMAAIMYNDVEIYKDDYNVYCRPWYANACEEIHFDSNAEILNQQNLDYQKAWVDMEMTPHRWYNVASPLYGVVAGDMYLPSVGASTPGRQMTELFAPITYNNTDKTKNDRFAPAVYQRGWDKGTETVYTVHNDVKTETETVALASTWSHVYNDVTEEYAPGMGYSVKTDVTRLPKFADSYSESDKQTYVKFRFPKADKTYNYFEDGNTTPGELNKDALPRVAKEQTEADKYYSHRLFEMNGTSQTVSLKKGNDGYLFLVGNPFMAHLDMAEFLKENEGVIQSKFWVMTETDQVGAVLNDSKDTEILTHTATDFARLAPMQGFFVQAKTAGTSLSIKFTPDMMAVEPYDTVSKPQLLKAPAYGTRGDGDDIIRVSTEESTAIIRLSAAADKGYAASEDVEMIDDSNQRNIRRIYTVAGTMASAINQTPDADGVEVGLMAPADSVTNVVFNGVALEDYMLYDTATGEMTQLYDGFELEMEGSVSGRYFLTAGIDTAEIEDGTIRIIPGRHEVVVTAPAVCGEMTVRVFDTLGREVAKAEGMEGEVRIALDSGIYAVEAVGADAGRKSAKLRIR